MNARTDGLAMTSVSLELGVALGLVAFGVFAILQFALPPDGTHAGAAERMPRRPLRMQVSRLIGRRSSASRPSRP